jgi:AraC family 4-hydroxyphenylacetate 3-monooxygenase operon regulatory protein
MNSAQQFARSNGFVPVFRGPAHRYRADACDPLIQAVSSARLKFAALARGHYPGGRLDPDVLPGVSSIGLWDAQRQQEWGLPWHRNEGIEIGFLESGSVDFAADGREFALRPGDITVTRPWQLHRMGRPNVGPNRFHWLILDVGVRRPGDSWAWPQWLLLSQRELGQIQAHLQDLGQPARRATPEMRYCFQEISHAVERSGNAGHISRLAIKINDILLSLLEVLESDRSRAREFSAGSRQTVHAFLSKLTDTPSRLGIPWSVDSMAAECGLRATQFVRYVKELTNQPPLHYLTQIRLEYATILLREKEGMAITEIALACGFGSSQYFATMFRKSLGISPSQFRCTLRS